VTVNAVIKKFQLRDMVGGNREKRKYCIKNHERNCEQNKNQK